MRGGNAPACLQKCSQQRACSVRRLQSHLPLRASRYFACSASVKHAMHPPPLRRRQESDQYLHFTSITSVQRLQRACGTQTLLAALILACIACIACICIRALLITYKGVTGRVPCRRRKSSLLLQRQTIFFFFGGGGTLLLELC